MKPNCQARELKVPGLVPTLPAPTPPCRMIQSLPRSQWRRTWHRRRRGGRSRHRRRRSRPRSASTTPCRTTSALRPSCRGSRHRRRRGGRGRLAAVPESPALRPSCRGSRHRCRRCSPRPKQVQEPVPTPSNWPRPASTRLAARRAGCSRRGLLTVWRGDEGLCGGHPRGWIELEDPVEACPIRDEPA